MTENSDHCFTQSFINIQNGNYDMSNNIPLSSPLVQAIINNRGIHDIFSQSNAQINNTCAFYTTAIPSTLGSLPEGTVFQMPDSTILTAIQGTNNGNEILAYKDLRLENRTEVNSNVPSDIISIPNYTIGISESPALNSALSNTIKYSGNLSDLDFSFLSESNEPDASSEEIPNLSSDSSKQFPQSIAECLEDSTESTNFDAGVPDAITDSPNAAVTDNTSNTENTDTVLVDVTKPIQLCQNSLIVVNGQKCVLQQDPQTGQVIAYPVKESPKPKKRRGRPRKVLSEMVANNSEPVELPIPIVENIEIVTPTKQIEVVENSLEDEHPKKNGLLEIVNDDGSLVRRSLRKRKRAKALMDYETGNLNPEIGSDAEESKTADKDDGEERVRKKAHLKQASKHKKNVDATINDGKRSRGRPKKDPPPAEPSQSFLIQMADGQSMMMQVPISSIPPGLSLQDVANGIAENFNIQAQQVNNSVNPPPESDSVPPAVDTSSTNVSQYLNQTSCGLSLPMQLDCDTEIPVSSQAMNNISEHSNSMSLLGSESNSFSCAALPPLTTTAASQILKMAESLSKDDLSSILRTATSTSLSSSPQKNSNDGTDFFSTENSVTTNSQSISEKFPFAFMVDGEMDESFLLSEQGMKDMAVLTKKLADKGSVPTVIDDADKSDNNKLDALYKNSEMMDDFDFPFADASEMKDKSSASFLQQCRQLINERGSENEDSIINVVDDDVEQILTSNQTACDNAIADHKYQSKPISDNLVNKSPAKDNSAISEFTISGSPISSSTVHYQIENPSDSVPCPINQNNAEISNGCNNIPSCSETAMTSQNALDLSLKVTDSQGTNKPAKRKRCYKKKNFYDSEPSVLDVESCMPKAISVPDVSSLLNAQGQESSELSRGLTTPSPSATTVIPLSEEMLSLIKKKNADGELSPEIEKHLICTKCGFAAISYDKYKEHLEIHVKDVQRCKCCKFVCLSEEEILTHYNDNHPRCICSICNYLTDQPYMLKRHMFRHTENGSACPICGKVYKDRYIMKMHVRLIHQPSSTIYNCEICEKTFNRKAHMRRHMRTHSTDKRYKCTHCDYRGTERSDVTKHQLIHEDPKLPCEICGKVFRHAKNRDLHMKRHNNQRDFKCGACDFYGYTFTDIRKHIERKHRPGKNTCPVCFKTFKSPETLKVHMDTDICKESMQVFAFDLPADSDIQLREDIERTGKYDVIASVITTEDLGDRAAEKVDDVVSFQGKELSADEINLSSGGIINVNDMLNTSNQTATKRNKC